MKKQGMQVLTLLLLILILAGCGGLSNKPETQINNITSNQNNLFMSKKLGFALEFPSTWIGNYLIHEYDDCIQVCFIGDSETSKQLNEESNQIQGLSMFYIGNETSIAEGMFVDSVNDVGTVDEAKFYYFTDTDFTLGQLDGEYIEDEKEKELAKRDFEKAMQMQKDIDSILATFKTNR